MAPTEPKSSMTRLVTEPSPPGPVPAQVRTSKAPGPNDPDLKLTWAHKAWVAGGCTTVLVALDDHGDATTPILWAQIEAFQGHHKWPWTITSQPFHAWIHSTKSKLPKIVVGLQDLVVLVSRSQHTNHHRPPYNGNYCIVSGVWNKFLDENKIFEILEMVLFFQFGLRPRSWNEPDLEWTQESSTSFS
ncbi:hypothetical protein Cgig2_030711 [Carnegiea gigantea]|uniref:Lipid desaturase domain-containing protein n=1 Tax=Carnegiea gigantea TaxID=171969 RepID=A0A9Q1K6E2_9CARY|nr:hypothetical protein Cgig2_030711 [Carnegiea gigantea]